MKGNEVSWFGIILNEGNDVFKLVDIMFPPQICKPTFVETDDEKFPKWYFDTFIKSNDPSKVRLHGHTHPNFSVTPSVTDVNQFKGIMQEVDDYYIQFIINNSHNVFCALHDKVTGEEIPMEVEFTFTKNLEEILKEVVTIPPPIIPTYQRPYIPAKYRTIRDEYLLEPYVPEELQESQLTDDDREYLKYFYGEEGIDEYEP